MGRKPALDDTKRAQVCALIAMGASRRHAATYVGCAASTIRHTAMHDRRFREQLRKAHLKAEMIPLKNLRNHAAKSWRAAAWLLERLYPGFYAKRGGNDLPTDVVREHVANLARQMRDEIPDAEVRARIDRKIAKWNAHVEKEQQAELDGLEDGQRWLKRQAALRKLEALDDEAFDDEPLGDSDE